ncbi:MAG: ABC transporter substrate-binding protein [Breznakibacter sp.]
MDRLMEAQELLSAAGHIEQPQSNSGNALVPGRDYLLEQNAKGFNIEGLGSNLLGRRSINPAMIAVWPEKFQARFDMEYSEVADSDNGSVINFKGDICKTPVLDTYLRGIVSIDELPDILVTTGMNKLYGHVFVKQLLVHDNYALLHPSCLLSAAGFYNAKYPMNVIAADALVMVLDKRQMMTRPHPKEWYELLAPWLENNIVMTGENDVYMNAVLFHLIKNYGLNAVPAFTRNISTCVSPSRILEKINGDKTAGHCMYVLPYSFARQISNNIDFDIVWPLDGAIAIPVQLLLKRDAAKAHTKLVQLLTGKAFRAALEQEGFVTNERYKELENQGKSLCWVGWNFIEQYDIAEMACASSHTVTEMP